MGGDEVSRGLAKDDKANVKRVLKHDSELGLLGYSAYLISKSPVWARYARRSVYLWHTPVTYILNPLLLRPVPAWARTASRVVWKVFGTTKSPSLFSKVIRTAAPVIGKIGKALEYGPKVFGRRVPVLGIAIDLFTSTNRFPGSSAELAGIDRDRRRLGWHGSHVRVGQCPDRRPNVEQSIQYPDGTIYWPKSRVWDFPVQDPRPPKHRPPRSGHHRGAGSPTQEARFRRGASGGHLRLTGPEWGKAPMVKRHPTLGVGSLRPPQPPPGLVGLRPLWPLLSLGSGALVRRPQAVIRHRPTPGNLLLHHPKR